MKIKISSKFILLCIELFSSLYVQDSVVMLFNLVFFLLPIP